MIQAGFHVPDPTRVPDRGGLASSTGLSPALAPLSSGLQLTLVDPMAPAPRPRVVSHPV